MVVRPIIAVPLSNIKTEEHKTVTFDCGVIATTMAGWTLFSWLKDGKVLNLSDINKYSIMTKINPEKSNFIKSLLTINNTSQEDEALYTCMVCYNSTVLEKFGIHGKFCNQTTGSLQVIIKNEGTYVYKLLSSSCVHAGNNSQRNKLQIILPSTLVPMAVVLIIVGALVIILLRKRFQNKDHIYGRISGM